MIREICKDEALSGPEGRTCRTGGSVRRQRICWKPWIFHREGCVGMAANMIGVNKRIIALENEGAYLVMLNPEILQALRPL